MAHTSGDREPEEGTNSGWENTCSETGEPGCRPPWFKSNFAKRATGCLIS